MIRYQPEQHKINALVKRALITAPQLEGYIQRAATIVAKAGFDADDAGNWSVWSCSDSNRSYAVSNDSCTCPSHTGQHAPLYATTYMCKHIIAFRMYRRLLQDDLNQRLAGDVRHSIDRTLCRLTPRTYLLSTDTTNIVTYMDDTHKIPTTVTNARPGRGKQRVFANSKAVADYAEWLDKAHALPDTITIQHRVDEDIWYDHYRQARAQGASTAVAANRADTAFYENYH